MVLVDEKTLSSSAPQVPLLRSPGKVPEDPVEFWLSRLDIQTRKAHNSHFNRWMQWLKKQSGWSEVTPRTLLLRRLEAEDPYEIVDIVQAYVNHLKLRQSSKKKAYSVIKSFFAHNRCTLPRDPGFKIRSDKPPVQAKLSLSNIIAICQTAKLRDRSVILFKWQSLLDNARLEYACKNCSGQIVQQIQDGIHPVRINIPGRKGSENDPKGCFYTFIGRDTVDALIQYFERERGWPREGEAVWLKSNGSSLTKTAFETMWLRLLRRNGTIPKRRGPVGNRLGYNPHEMRDVAKSLLHTHAKKDGFDMDCAEFWLGHTVDPLGYDKFFNDKEYVRKQYLIAEKYLNIISVPSPSEEVKRQEDEIKKMQERLAKLEAVYSEKLKIKET